MLGTSSKGWRMKRIEIETKLNENRVWILGQFEALSPDQLSQPLTPSEHDPDNYWTALDHFAHLALIELNFAQMIRRHVAGDENPVGLRIGKDGQPRSREQVMAGVHAMTDEFQRAHRGDNLSQVVALTASARGETLRLLSELSDEQLAEVLPGAPWEDGTVGGVLTANAGHGRMHWDWVREAQAR